jgi:hypothetical protein
MGSARRALPAPSLPPTKINCAEPEQTIKNKVGDIVTAALSSFPANTAVRIGAGLPGG